MSDGQSEPVREQTVSEALQRVARDRPDSVPGQEIAAQVHHVGVRTTPPSTGGLRVPPAVPSSLELIEVARALAEKLHVVSSGLNGHCERLVGQSCQMPQAGPDAHDTEPNLTVLGQQLLSISHAMEECEAAVSILGGA